MLFGLAHDDHYHSDVISFSDHVVELARSKHERVAELACKCIVKLLNTERAQSDLKAKHRNLAMILAAIDTKQLDKSTAAALRECIEKFSLDSRDSLVQRVEKLENIVERQQEMIEAMLRVIAASGIDVSAIQ